MTAKNLGAASVTKGLYRTPPSMPERLIEVCPHVQWAGERGPVWEPCADIGTMVRVMRKAWPRATIFASDIRDGLVAKQREAGASSAWAANALDGFDQGLTLPFAGLTMTNPDFAIFDPLVVMHRHRYPLATLALLGRAGMYAGAEKRVANLATIGHPDTYNLPERGNFITSQYASEDGQLLAWGGSDSAGCSFTFGRRHAARFRPHVHPSPRDEGRGQRLHRADSPANRRAGGRSRVEPAEEEGTRLARRVEMIRGVDVGKMRDAA